ncbi:MAG: riboflavin biosynthesis protein RibF [Candidatus Aureabacteria bacterium]|nr:riboflavin biosynthesis protein RibF [Candidatus Auribacterota bacterium]
MKVVSGLDSGEVRNAPAVVLTMGVFDGVHLGHRRVIETLVSQSRRVRGTAALLTFHPHPRQVLGGEEPLLLLTSPEHRIRLLGGTGLDICIVLPFSRQMAGEDAAAFVVNHLVSTMDLRMICVGPQFVFGARRSGDAELLRRLGMAHGFSVEVVEGVMIGGVPVSSTAIREMVGRGDIASASRFLGRPYSICGTVVRGKALGREWGVPTANVSVEGVLVPPPGVYAARAFLGESRYDGVLNIDRRGGVEVHLFALRGSIYGEILEIVVGELIREERDFPGTEALAAQVRCDIEIARGMLHNNQG